MSDNYYSVLGVDKSADAETIKKAYRKLASKHHPDKGGDTAHFQKIQTAYETLSDATKRAAYDNPQPQGIHFGFGGGSPHDVEAMMREMMYSHGFHHRQPPQNVNRNVRIQIALSLEATLTEQVRVVDISMNGGSSEQVEIKIPAGVQSGMQIRYPNIGDQTFKDKPRGDVYVQFVVHGRSDFDQNGLDLYKEAVINCFQAILGCTIDVVGLDGKHFELVVPEGTQPDTKLAIQNQGIPAMMQAGRGRLIVVIKVKVPTSLTDDQKKLVEELNTV